MLVRFKWSGLIVALGVGAHLQLARAHDHERLLVGNSGDDSIVAFDEHTGHYLGAFIAAGSGGLIEPDALSFGPDGQLYVSSGRGAGESAILRYDTDTGAFVDRFAEGGGLTRPYGHAWGPDGLLYVSSFLSDQVLRYDSRTGEFVDVFTHGTGEPGGANGPNGLAFGPDNKLYATTEGSVLGEFPGLPSEVLRFDIETGESETFIAQPEPSPASPGYVSLLGIVFGPDCQLRGSRRFPACDVFVSDFASDIRRYDRHGELLAQLSTNYTGTIPSSNATGALSFGAHGRLFTVGFDQRDGAENIGAVLRFDARTNAAWPLRPNEGALFVAPGDVLSRPIGVLSTTTRPELCAGKSARRRE